MNKREVVLITGANTGIGFQVVRALCESSKSYEILLGGRSFEKAKQAARLAEEDFPSSLSKVSPIKVDIEDDDSIQKAFEEVKDKYGHLDALFNNAGASFDQHIVSGKMTTREAWNASWNVNTTGTHIMTSTFVPLLLASPNPRLLFNTSGTSTLAGTSSQAIAANKPPAKGWPKENFFSIAAYRSSKTGMNMMMREWCRVLAEDGVKVWCISPGFLATGLGGNPEMLKKMGAGDPVVAGLFVRSVLEGKRDADVGKVVNRDGVQPW